MRRGALGLGLIALCAASPARADGGAASDRTVCIQPLGRYDKKLVPNIAAGIELIYGFEVRVLKRQKMPGSAYYKPRKRHRAGKLLDWLDDNVTDESCDWVIGFTKQDISTTKGEIKDWGILGLGDIGGRSCVVSSYRMKRKVKWKTVQKRAVKVAIHELGHVLGLYHLNKPGCVMHDAEGTVKTVDTETGVLCQESRDKIEKRHGISLPVHDEMDWNKILSKG